jgi:Rnl2 family RNA ligase
MEFKKYNSLENVKQKLVTVIENHGYANELYVVTEKVHGANFGIHFDVDNNDLKFSRRKDFLGETENFYGYTAMLTEFREAMAWISSTVEVKEIRIFGELFGGSLNGQQGDHAKCVQSEVQYSPNNEFMAFELHLDGIPQPFNVMASILRDAGLKVVPVLGMADNIYDALKFVNDDNSVVPQILGYESPEVNIKEGNVIVPAGKVLYFGNGKRVAIKDKNRKFKESDNEKVITKPVDLSEQGEVVLAAVNANLTTNRLSNVLSKESVEGLTGKDFGRIMGLLMQDALAEYSDEFTLSAKEVAGEEWPLVSKALIREATTLTRTYFIENIF